MISKVLAKSLFFVVLCAAMLVSCKKSKVADVDVFDAVPEHTSLVVRTDNVDSVAKIVGSDNPLLKMFYNQKTEIGLPLCRCVDSLKNAGLFGGHLGANAVFAVRKDGTCGLCQLYVCKTDLRAKGDIGSAVDSIMQNENFSKRLFGEFEVLTYSMQGRGSLSISFVDGLAIVSSSSKYLEDALTCYAGNGKRLSADEKFCKALEASGKNELANVLVDVKSFADIFSCELFEDNRLVKVVRGFDCWLALDILEGNPLSFSGFEYPMSDSATFSALVKSQPSIEFNVLEMIPEKSAAYLLVSYGNPQGYDEAIGKSAEREERIAAMNKAFGCDAVERFRSLVKREFAYVVSECSSDQEKGAFVICGLQSQSAAELELQKMLPQPAAQILDEGSSVKVYQMPYDDIAAALFGDLFANCRGNFVSFIGNYMIFANSVSDLRSLNDDIKLNNTMRASMQHQEFRKKFSTTSSVFAYFSFGKGIEMMKRFFSRQYSNDLGQNASAFAGMGMFGIQLKRLDEQVYCNVSFLKNDVSAVASMETEWETNVGTTLAGKPYVVSNHDTGEKEIIVQDKDNKIYLFNSKGQELWHIGIDGRIISQIVQVDAYKNGKKQYLFSTDEKIYLVDRLGNNLEKFPQTLRSKSVVPIAVFDYDKTLNYRIAVPCEDRKVYMYDIKGDLLKGWTFETTENIVNSELVHYVLSSEDFIVFHDSYKAYFIARNGSAKMVFQTNFKYSDNKFYCDSTSSPKFVTTDETGTVRRLFKNGSQDSLKLGDFSAGHHFAMRDLDADGRPEYIFTDSTKIFAYAADQRLLFDYDFGAEASAPTFYSFGGQTRIGITTSDKKIYLLNSNGSLYEGFPLEGVTPFSISELKADSDHYDLIVGLSRGRLGNYRIVK